jgi:hypothetical protein
VTVTFQSQSSASFHLTGDVVTRLVLQLNGVEHSVSLVCDGGLREVRFQSVRLFSLESRPGLESTTSLLFDMGPEEARAYGRLPRVQMGFQDGRFTGMLVAHATGTTSTNWEKHCAEVQPDPICAPDAPPPRTQNVRELVAQLRTLPTPLAASGRDSADEALRRSVYQQLLVSNSEAVAALAQGLRDPYVGMRRNAALALHVLGGGWWRFECGQQRVEIGAALPMLVDALTDSDASVRAWSAQAIGGIGASAASAVPALITLLANDDEGSRNSACIALRGIGPAANAALPALQRARADPSSDVRRFAALAIESIEQ